MHSKKKRVKTHPSSHPHASQPAEHAKPLPAARMADASYPGVVIQDAGHCPSQKHPSSSSPPKSIDDSTSGDVSDYIVSYRESKEASQSSHGTVAQIARLIDAMPTSMDRCQCMVKTTFGSNV